MHVSDELMHDVLKHFRRPALPDTGEISKTTALLYLAPEIIKLRLLGDSLDQVCELLSENGIQISKPHMLKTLRPSTLLVEQTDD